MLRFVNQLRPRYFWNLPHVQGPQKPASRHCRLGGFIFGNSEVGGITKIGTQDDTVLLDSCDRGYVAKVLQAVCSRVRSQDDSLFPSWPWPNMSSCFEMPGASSNLDGSTPHPVRHLGPSADFYLKQDAPLKSKQGAEVSKIGNWLLWITDGKEKAWTNCPTVQLTNCLIDYSPRHAVGRDLFRLLGCLQLGNNRVLERFVRRGNFPYSVLAH